MLMQTNWQKAAEFHGHYCPGLAIGFRAAQIAMKKLGINRDSDEQLIAFVENDSCAVDGIQVLTGCTIGKGNLILRNTGKQVYTIARRSGGQAIRISLKHTDHNNQESNEQRIQRILEAPEDEIFKICESYIKLPEKARLFKSIQCSECGEGVAEVKAVVKDGKLVCMDCAGEKYTRGW